MRSVTWFMLFPKRKQLGSLGNAGLSWIVPVGASIGQGHTTLVWHRWHSHNAISTTGKKLNKDELEKRQKELMAKSLPKRNPIPGVKKVVLIASGKGGVGKSTVAVNLAVAVKALYPTKDVSLLDADVFGPSLPRMMNLSGEPFLTGDNRMVPLQNHGVKCMSMGFLVNENAPVVWRGLMVMSAIEKLVRGVDWSPSDILFVDMPPGTGDTQLSFAQTVEVDGAVIVTSSQQVAMQDAIKGVEMFKKTNVPVLGYVSNMSAFICPSCGTTKRISSKTKSFSSQTGVEMLGEIPFNIEIGDCSDEGNPLVVSNPDSPYSNEFRRIAEQILKKLGITKRMCKK